MAMCLPVCAIINTWKMQSTVRIRALGRGHKARIQSVLCRKKSQSTAASHPSFTIVRSESVKEYAAVANVYRHNATGAELISIKCDETEKVFGIAFRTVPSDDVGTAHILEHSVLCGSAKFPTKEPFVELMKSSLQTYLNAMTYPDRTVYPVASPNTKDFHNLVRVYLDAALAPRLEPWALQQEGHHITPQGLDQDAAGDAAAPTSGLVYKGVVFNEMKGVYSSGDSVHGQACEEALFPDTEYSHASGGDPRAIPKLTYEQFTQFHADNYAPSRARLFFFGDDPEPDRLSLAAEALENAAPGGVARKGQVQPAAQQKIMSVQPPFPQPIFVRAPYPAAGGDAGGQEGEMGVQSEHPGFVVDPSLGPSGGLVPAPVVAAAGAGLPAYSTEAVSGVPNEHFVTVNWCLTGAMMSGATTGPPRRVCGTLPAPPALHEKEAAHLFQPADKLGLALLSHLLMGTQASTLRKALTDSGLGSGVTGGGLDDGLLQPVFAAGLKGVKAEDVMKVEPLILHTLTMAAGGGFEPEHIASAVNTLEFQLREFASGGAPRGLSLFLSAVPGWIYGRDPIAELRYEDTLMEVKARLAKEGSGYFQSLVRRFFLSNPHRATVHSYPDPAWTGKREKEEAEELRQKEQELSKQTGGLQSVVQQATELLQRQESPDSAEALATIPTLSVADLDTKQPPPLHLWVSEHHVCDSYGKSKSHSWLLRSDQPTAGIGYLSVHFNIDAVPPHLLPLLPLFAWCLTSTGTKRMDEVTLSRALGAHTGGVRASVGAMDIPGSIRYADPRLTVSGKALSHQGGMLAELMEQILTEARFDAKDRIIHALKDTVARHKAGLVGSGHRYAGGLLNACMTQSGWLAEAWGGYTGLHTARSILGAVAGAQAGDVLEPSIAEKISRASWESAYAELPSSLRTAEAAFIPPASFEELVSQLNAIRAILLSQAAVYSSVMTCNMDGGISMAMHSAHSSLMAALPEGDKAKEFITRQVHTPAAAATLLYPGLRAYAADKTAALQALEALQPGQGSDGQAAGVAIVAPSAQVNFVVKAGSTVEVYRERDGPPGGAEVASAVLRNGFLWEKVRVQGGAYGGFASFNKHNYSLSFASYRDPHVARTLGIYDAAGAHLKELAASAAAAVAQSELKKAIISTIGGMDAPLSPAERGEVAAARWHMLLTQEKLQQRRDEVLATGVKDLEQFAEAAEHVAKTGRVAVVGSEKSLTAPGSPNLVLLRPMQ